MDEHLWLREYKDNLQWDCPLPEARYIETLLLDAATAWPDKTGFDFYDRTFSFRELAELARKFAKGLQLRGVLPGDSVAVHLPNSPHYPVAFFGTLLAGARVVNCNPAAGADEIRHQLRDSNVTAVITFFDSGQTTMFEACQACGIGTVIVCEMGDFGTDLANLFGSSEQPRELHGAAESFRGLTDNDGRCGTPQRTSPSDEIAVLQYTGGTTGEPKGAMLTHANLWYALAVTNHSIEAAVDHGPEKVLIVLPLFHAFGAIALLSVVSRGIEAVLHFRFDALSLLRDIERKRVTSFSAVPTMFAAIVQHPKCTEFDLSSLRRIHTGGAPIADDVLTRFERLSGLVPLAGYGLSETVTVGTIQKVARELRRDTVGIPLPHTIIEIVDAETGMNLVPTGQVGEVCIRGPHVMKGYWNNPKATAEALRGGRFHTGDLGFLDQRGYLTIVDRKKDMIICGGANVFTRNVEVAIESHASVANVAVVGVPDPVRGEAVMAFVVFRPDAERFTLAQLRAFLGSRLAAHEIPTDMEVRDSLPKTAVGKISKVQLLESAVRAAR